LLRHYSESAFTNTIARFVLKANAVFGIAGYKSSDAGAATTAVAALDPALGELKGTFILWRWHDKTRNSNIYADAEGIYLQDCQFGSPAPHASEMEIAEKLWSLSEDLVKEKFPV
jgi:hypothetical protein